MVLDNGDGSSRVQNGGKREGNSAGYFVCDLGDGCERDIIIKTGECGWSDSSSDGQCE
jgi:hypothetical protein